MPESDYPQETTLSQKSSLPYPSLAKNQQGSAGLRRVLSYPGRDGGQSSEELRLPGWSEKLPKDEWDEESLWKTVSPKQWAQSLHQIPSTPSPSPTRMPGKFGRFLEFSDSSVDFAGNLRGDGLQEGS